MNKHISIFGRATFYLDMFYHMIAMSRTDIMQKQFGVNQMNTSYVASQQGIKTEPVFIIKTMMQVVKKIAENMNHEDRMRFTETTDAIVRMAEEMRD